jgi:hypothetical protein
LAKKPGFAEITGFLGFGTAIIRVVCSIAIIESMKYIYDPPKSPLKRGTSGVSPNNKNFFFWLPPY